MHIIYDSQEVRMAGILVFRQQVKLLEYHNEFGRVSTSLEWLLSLIAGQDTKVQSTLVISKSKGLSKILRDIRTSTYQICRI